MSLSPKIHQALQGIIEKFKMEIFLKPLLFLPFLFPTYRLLNGPFLTGPLCLLPGLEAPEAIGNCRKLAVMSKKG